MKNFFLTLALACLANTFAQNTTNNIPVFTDWDSGITAVTRGDAWALDTNNDGIHNRVGVMGVSALALFVHESPLFVGVYDFDTTQGKYVINQHLSDQFEPLAYGVFIPQDMDGKHGTDFLQAGSSVLRIFSDDIHTIIHIDNGDGTYTRQNLEGLNEVKAAFGNFYGGTHKDLVITGKDIRGRDRFMIYRNDNGVFTKTVDIIDGLYALGLVNLVVDDFNNDGYDDIAYNGVNHEATVGYFLLGNGKGEFNRRDDFPALNKSTISAGDVNGDNIEDIIVSGDSGLGSKTEICAGDGQGNFTPIHENTIQSYSRSTSLLYDFTDSGKKTLYLGGQILGWNYKSAFYSNDGTGLFTEIESLQPKAMVDATKPLILNIELNDQPREVFFVSGNNGGSTIDRTNRVHIESLIIGEVNTTLSVTPNAAKETFTVTPNPVVNYLHINNNNNAQIKNIAIFNTMGQSVFNSTLAVNNIDVTAYNTGIYFLRITLKNGKVYQEKIIKN